MLTMATGSIIELATALLGGLVAAGATLLTLFWQMGESSADHGLSLGGNLGPGPSASEQRIDDLRDYLDSQFATVDQRFETMQAQLDRRFDAVEGRIDRVDEEMGILEARVDELNHD